MKNRRFLYGIFLVAILMIAIFAVFVLPVGIPETEDITKFEHIDIDLSDNSYGFYYSFIPDGSGIVYVDSTSRENTDFKPAKLIYYHLDFKSKDLRVIHEIDFAEDHSGTPVVYWRDARILFMSAERDDRECTPEILADSINFNLDTNEKTLPVCSDRNGLTNPEIETSDYPDIYTRDDLPKQRVEIHSADGRYYFLWKLEFDCFFLTCYFGEAAAKSYIEVYNSKDKMIRRIYLGESGQMTDGPLYTGYVGFWSNTNEIVVIPDVGSWIQPISYKVYFIDPEK